MASPLVLPGELRAYELGLRQNHATLNALLSTYAFGKFWVTNEGREKELRGVRCAFDDDVNSYVERVLPALLSDGDHEALFRLLLSLGLDPDKPDKRVENNRRASHLTTYFGRPSCARALAPCRPDVKAIDAVGGTPRTVTVGVSELKRHDWFGVGLLAFRNFVSTDPRFFFSVLQCRPFNGATVFGHLGKLWFLSIIIISVLNM